jgi:DNA polymerase V
MSSTKLVALVDCNSFYASCEQVFRPDLLGKPVIVLSNNDGAIVARSAEAKALGIEMGVPLFEIKHLVAKHRVAVFSSNYTLYGDMSRRVMQVLDQFSPEIENYSIDESFLTLPDCEPLEFGADIKKTVKKWTGIPVSVGISTTKTLSKLANRLAKKQTSGVRVLTPDDPILEKVDVADVWGIGSASAKKLRHANINTVAALRDADDRWILKTLSVVGLKLVHELRGTPCLPLELVREPKKGMCVSRSFGQEITTLDQLKEAVATFAARIGEKLRSQHSLAAVVSVFINTNQFKNDPQYHRSGAVRLLVPSAAGNELIHWTTALAEKLFREGYRFKKAGVIVQEIVSDSARQQNLFYKPDTVRDDRVSSVMDRINHEFGRRSIQFAAEGIKTPWAPKFESRSPRYTTRWDELLEVG